MRSFKDRNGREWSIALTIGSLKRIRDTAGVDLLDLAHHERCQPLIDRLTTDPLIICDVIWIAVNPDIPKEQFADGFDGDVVEAATEALLKAITDFSPRQRRSLLAKVIEKLSDLEKKQAAAAIALLDDPRMEQAMDAMLNPGPSSTASPASSVSNPPA